MKLAAVFLISLLAAAQAPPASSTEAMYRAAADSARTKMNFVEQNAQRTPPDTRPTQFTENELTAYVNSGDVKLPKGVSKVTFRGTDSVVNTRANVDFDQVTAGNRAANPFMSLFSGVHDVDITAHAVGISGQGRVHIDSVAIDGVGVPRAALTFFVNRYIKPKHPELGLDSTFALPARIDSAVVGKGTLTLRQK